MANQKSGQPQISFLSRPLRDFAIGFNVVSKKISLATVWHAGDFNEFARCGNPRVVASFYVYAGGLKGALD
jgi:hypothetical protein